MAIFESIPALVRLTVVFIFVIISIRKKVSLGNIFFAGALILGLIFGLSPYPMAKSIVHSVLYPKTLALSAIVSLILVLSNSMEQAGQMEKLLKNFKGLIKNPKLNIIIFPALIGLLPMPGGAVFSAPMVRELGAHSRYSPAKLSFINYWFRHIWEYCWPLYPGVLLITVLANIHIGSLMLCMGPMTGISLLIGYLLLRKNGNKERDAISRHGHPPVWPFFKELLPVLIVIIPGLGMGVLFSSVFPDFDIAKETGLIAALVLAIGFTWQVNHLTKETIRKILFDPQLLRMMYMVFSILVFKGMLEDSNAVKEITHELTLLKIPLVLIVALLPFMVGLISGITIAFVGSVFPILISLIGSIDPAGGLLAYIMLAMVCGFVGVLLSPVHLCFILSNEYFGAPMDTVYRHLFLPCGSLITAGFIYFYLLRLCGAT